MKPSHVLTLTFADRSTDDLAVVKKYINKASKYFHQHIFVEIHSDIQHERKSKHFTKKRHYHLTLAFEYPDYIETELLQMDLDLIALGLEVNMSIHIEKYRSRPNEVGYFMVGHESYDGLWCGCPRKRKCRRRNGCGFRNNPDSWTLDRYKWK